SGVQEAAARIFDTSAADYFAAMTRNINAIFDMANQLTGSLNVLLNKRVEKFHREVLYTLASTGLGLLVVSVIGCFIMRDITVPFRRVVGFANQIATGDLTLPAASESRKDEIGVLARALDRSGAALKEMASMAERIAGGEPAIAA